MHTMTPSPSAKFFAEVIENEVYLKSDINVR